MHACSGPRYLTLTMPDVCPDMSSLYMYRMYNLVSAHCHAHTCHLHVHIICMSSTHAHVIRTSSAALLMVSVDLNYLSTLTGTGY